MASSMLYTQAVTEYFSAIPMSYEQEIFDNLNFGISDGLSKEEIKPQLYFSGIPKMPDIVFEELYNAMVKATK